MVRIGSSMISPIRRIAAASLAAGAMLAFAGHANIAASQGANLVFSGPAPDVFSGGSLIIQNGGGILVNDQGQLVIRDGGDLVIEDGAAMDITDSGSVTIEDSTASVAGTFSMQSTGRVEFNNSFLNLNSQNFVQSSGTFELDSNSSINGDGAYTLNGGTAVMNGQVVLQSGFGIPGVFVPPPSTIAVNGGTLQGSGLFFTDGVVNTGGTVAPGNSTGTMTMLNDYTQGPGGALAIEIDSLLAFDVLDILGGAELDGILDLQVDAGYAATAADGDMFTIVNWNSFSGGFASVTGLNFAPDKFFSLDYGATGLTLTVSSSVVAAPEPGVIALFGLGLAGIGIVRRRRPPS